MSDRSDNKTTTNNNELSAKPINIVTVTPTKSPEQQRPGASATDRSETTSVKELIRKFAKTIDTDQVTYST